MAGNFIRIHFAICAFLILAFSLSGRSGAQSNTIPSMDSPSQRWLPPPRSYPNQPDSQAKLLSSLRDLVLKNSPSIETNPSRLTDADVQSLKEAMKQYAGNLPDGLSADSLDAIPPELISKALSNPELMRQAKELSEQFMKTRGPKSADNSNKPVDPASNETPPTKANISQTPSKQNNNKIENQIKPNDVAPQSPKPREGLNSQNKAKNDGFTDLMEKLRKTQQQFEKGQNPSEDVPPPGVRSNANQPANSSNSETPKASGPPKPNATSGAKRPGAAQPGSTGSERSESALRPGTMPSADNRSNPRLPQSERSRQSPTVAQDESDPFDSKPNDSTLRDATGSKLADGSAESKSTSSMDIRKELDRRGFGPTLQKIIEEAQRSSQSSRVANPSLNGAEASANAPKMPNKSVSQPATSELLKRSAARPPNSASAADSVRPPAKPDSAMSKSFQDTGKYLNKLWTQISKSNQSTTRAAASPSPRSTPQVSSTNEAFWLSNPFHARVLEGLVVLAVVGAIAYFAFRYRVRSEQVRREQLESQLAPRIDEIRTRDDVVRAFHALARQRFQSAQAWWTVGYVTEQFHHALPEHSAPIRTLSGIYEQARYFPAEHQLTADQIEDAKLALKQCKA